MFWTFLQYAYTHDAKQNYVVLGIIECSDVFEYLKWPLLNGLFTRTYNDIMLIYLVNLFS
jgi:hypothetical protein